MESKATPDQIIEELGGCGRFQIRMAVIIHMMKTVICWSAMSMVVVSATPPWWCDNHSQHDVTNINMTHQEYDVNTTANFKSCTATNDTKCTNFRFDDSLDTIVGEFNLVCDRAYIPSTVMSIQNIGTLIGNLMAGQLADLYGRKIPFFASLVMLISANLVTFFCNSWILFAAARLVIGAGTGFFLTIQYNLLSEFSLSRWRAWIIGFPSWPIQTCLFALFTWLIQDWRYITLMCSLVGIPFLFAWWSIPESFRWYIAHDRPRDAEQVIRKVSKYNKRPESIHTKRLLESTETAKKDIKYTVLDLFKSRFLIKVTFLSAFNWVGLGLISYGISFGIQTLSGNIYLNLFLFNLFSIPSKAASMWLQNRFGRRKTAMFCYGVTAVGGLVVGIVQYIDTDYRVELTNGFAILSNVGIQTTWGPVQTMTVELYPTVVRNIGFGTLSTIARLGAILGPQLVFLNSFVPGLLYFVCGGLSTLCVCGLFGLPETMDVDLTDKIQHKTIHVESDIKDDTV